MKVCILISRVIYLNITVQTDIQCGLLNITVHIDIQSDLPEYHSSHSYQKWSTWISQFKVIFRKVSLNIPVHIYIQSDLLNITVESDIQGGLPEYHSSSWYSEWSTWISQFTLIFKAVFMNIRVYTHIQSDLPEYHSSHWYSEWSPWISQFTLISRLIYLNVTIHTDIQGYLPEYHSSHSYIKFTEWLILSHTLIIQVIVHNRKMESSYIIDNDCYNICVLRGYFTTLNFTSLR